MQPEKDGFIYGLHELEEAIDAGKPIDKVLMQDTLRGTTAAPLRRLLKDNHIPFQMVPVQKLNAITTKNHQGVVTFLSEVGFQDVEEVVIEVFERGEVPFIVVADHISDVRNFGALCRSALAAGAHAVVVPAKGSARIGADAVNTSAGALHKLPLCREGDITQALKRLSLAGLHLFAATEKAGANHFEARFDQPLALVLGSEHNGIASANLKAADQHIKIPIVGDIDSLNVSVAAGIIFYEIVRQRYHL